MKLKEFLEVSNVTFGMQNRLVYTASPLQKDRIMPSLKSRLHFYAFAIRLIVRQTLESPATNQLARTILTLTQLHLAVMFMFLVVLSPLPAKPSLLDFLVLWTGSYAGALVLLKTFQLIRRPIVRAHWIGSPQSRRR